MTGKAIGIDLNIGYEGEISRTNPNPVIFTRPAGEQLDFGTAVVVNDKGQYVTYKEGNTLDQFAGIISRAIKQSVNYLQQDGKTGFQEDNPASALMTGYIIINVGDSTPKAFGKVYLDPKTSKFTATQTNNIELTSARFSTGTKDANNNTEIEIGYLPMVAKG